MCIRPVFQHLASVNAVGGGTFDCGILECIRQFPDSWKPIFTHSDVFQMTGDQFLDKVVVEYSSSQIVKDLEMNTYKVFCDVMQSIYEDGSYQNSVQYQK